MAKVIRKKKRRLKKSAFVILLFSFSFGLFLFKSLYLGSLNTRYTIDIQKTENEIAEIQDSNKQLLNSINDLTNKDRIYSIAQEGGLTINQDNIVSIQDSNEK